jgi:hypothetical protein
MSGKKSDKSIHIPHRLWAISCELEGLGMLLQNQETDALTSFHYAEGLEGLGRICARNANRLRNLSTLVDELEVEHAQNLLKFKNHKLKEQKKN